MIYGSSPHHYAFTDLATEAIKAASLLSPYHERYDTIACQGISGLALAAPLSVMLNKHLVVIRKGEERAHSTIDPGIRTCGKRWIFVDDFIDSGNTSYNVERRINEQKEGMIRVGEYTMRDGVHFKQGMDYDGLTLH